jgi:hypothetical protein
MLNAQRSMFNTQVGAAYGLEKFCLKPQDIETAWIGGLYSVF